MPTPPPGSRASVPLPRVTGSELVLAPPPGEGHWVGAPSAVLADGVFHLAYRLRAPLGEGRGQATVVARSADGVRFETLGEVTKDAFGAESLERPALVRTPVGRWRLYVSCATPGTKHWRVDVLEADDPAGLAGAPARTVLPGSDEVAVKDPVVRHVNGSWHLWASVHPLERWEDADRMTTQYATSTDGLDWAWQGTALAGRPGAWDARGVRFSSVVLNGGAPVALYDGRATAAENWEERTGVAFGTALGEFRATGDEPAAQSPYAPHGLRYVDAVPLGAGAYRLYYEMTRPDGAHELRTELWQPE